jgi:hypothetical protein
MRAGTIGVAIAVALAALAGVAVVAAQLWRAVGDSTISLAGWLALGLGVLVTLALGIGLMTLVFVSSRYGYDDRDGKDR